MKCRDSDDSPGDLHTPRAVVWHTDPRLIEAANLFNSQALLFGIPPKFDLQFVNSAFVVLRFDAIPFRYFRLDDPPIPNEEFFSNLISHLDAEMAEDRILRKIFEKSSNPFD